MIRALTIVTLTIVSLTIEMELLFKEKKCGDYQIY